MKGGTQFGEVACCPILLIGAIKLVAFHIKDRILLIGVIKLVGFHIKERFPSNYFGRLYDNFLWLPNAVCYILLQNLVAM